MLNLPMVMHIAMMKEFSNMLPIGNVLLLYWVSLLNKSVKTLKPKSPNHNGVPVANALFSCVVATIAIQTGSAIENNAKN